MSKPLSREMRSQCRDVLSRCREFKDHNYLKSIFDVQDLYAYKNSLPESGDIKQRILETINFLQENSSEDKSLLIIFLEELKSVNSEDHPLCVDLDKCISYIAGVQGQKVININKDKIIPIPFVIAAMTQEEARDLLSGKAFEDPNTYKNDQMLFEKVKEILKTYEIENLESRYGEKREEWMPYLESQESIGTIIQEACKKINFIKKKSIEQSCNNSDDLASDEIFLEVEPEFVSSGYFKDDEIRDRLRSSGVVLIMDDLSFFHPTLRIHLNKIISNERAAIIMLSTLSGRSRDQPFYDLIDDAIKVRLTEAHERYYNNLDPKCEIRVDDLWSFRRWLSKVLPDEANFIGKKQPHPESRKTFQDIYKGAYTSTRGPILGVTRRAGDRR
ncbi:MAG: hypothetical protein E4G89_03935 [Methanothrix sp.]|nr:MAG: hypothetical protein E4G89_03935 [Methanothrix sp.]